MHAFRSVRLQTDCPELRVVSDELTRKYGKEYAQAALRDQLGKVGEKLKVRLPVFTLPAC